MRPDQVELRSRWRAGAGGLLAAASLLLAAALSTGAPVALRLLLLAAAAIALSVPRGRTPLETHVTKVLSSRLGAERTSLFDIRPILGPVICILVGVLAGIIDSSRIGGVIGDKLPIIAFIMAFAYLCEGVAESGYFEYASYTIAAKCQGSTSRLIVYMFLLSSVFAVITSNDIVILSLTPITLAIAQKAEMKNARLLLLSQFIAANTLSMSLYTGSPTNIIVSERLNLNFFSYILLMAVPSAVALFATLGAIALINYVSGPDASKARASGSHPPSAVARRWARWRSWLNYNGRWEFSPTYTQSRTLLPPSIKPEMSVWVRAFWAAVFFVAVASLFHASLLLSAGATFVLSMLAYSLTFGKTRERRISRRSLAVHLPYAIPFFALAMFTITDALTQSPFAQSLRNGLISSSDSSFLATALAWGATGGVLVNVLNDLPASDLLSQLFYDLPFTRFQEYAALQAMLVTINIGTYLTPIGALAGLIWLQALQRARSELDEAGFAIPTLRDLIKYGVITFTITFAFTMASIATLGIILNYLVSGGGRHPQINVSWIEFLCVVAALGGFFLAGRWFVSEVGRLNVIVTHFTDLFRGLTYVRQFSQRRPITFSALVSLAFVCFLAAMIYGVEFLHTRVYDAPFFVHDFGEYVKWAIVFMFTTLDEPFPDSIGAGILAALLPTTAIAIVIYFFRVLPKRISTKRFKRARARNAEHRFFVLNCSLEATELMAFLGDVQGVGPGDPGRRHDSMVIAVPRKDLHDQLMNLPQLDAPSVVLLEPPERWERFIEEYRLVESHLVVFELSASQLDVHEAFLFLGAYAKHVARRESPPEDPASAVILVPNRTVKDVVAKAAHRIKLDVTVISFGEDLEEYLVADVAGDEKRLSTFYPEVSDALKDDVRIEPSANPMLFRRRKEEPDLAPEPLQVSEPTTRPVDGEVVVGLVSDYADSRGYVVLSWGLRSSPETLGDAAVLVVTNSVGRTYEPLESRPPARVILVFAEDAVDLYRRAIEEACPNLPVDQVDLPRGGVAAELAESTVGGIADAVVTGDSDDERVHLRRKLSPGDRILVFRPNCESRSESVRTRFVSALALARAHHEEVSGGAVTVVVESSLRDRTLDLESFEVDEVFDSQFACASFFRTVGLLSNVHLFNVAAADRSALVHRVIGVARSLRRYWLEPLPPERPVLGGTGPVVDVYASFVRRELRPVVPIGILEMSWNGSTKEFEAHFQLGLQRDPQPTPEGHFRYAVCLAQL